MYEIMCSEKIHTKHITIIGTSLLMILKKYINYFTFIQESYIGINVRIII